MKKSRIITLFYTCCVGFVFAQDIIPQGKMYSAIESFKNDPDIMHSSWAVNVVKVADGKELLAVNSKQSLVPASALKILTTGAALSILGVDFCYETRIEYDGEIDTVNGVLKGNIYITGSGDPTLGSELFKGKNDSLTVTEAWAATIKNKGIKKITGSIIADASVFEEDMLPPTWIWSDMGNYYGAGACGLNFMDNKYTVYFNSGDNGSLTKVVKIFPEIPGIEFVNNVKSGGSSDNAFIYGSPYSYYRIAKGTIPPNKNNYDVDGSMPDPSFFCAYNFKEALTKIGIEVFGEATTVRILNEKNKIKPGLKKTLHVYCSPSLDKIVYYTNFKSNNVYAESILKTLAVKKGFSGTTNSGTEVVKNFWKSKGVDIGGLYMADGSGLSRFNTVTVQLQVEVLRKLANEPYFEVFNKSLPVAGKSGSLSSMCKGSFAENNLRAKSGYITRVRAYSGYVKNKKGEELAFSIIVNNYDCPAGDMKFKMEKLMELIPELE